jgi:acetylornithine deacetylase
MKTSASFGKWSRRRFAGSALAGLSLAAAGAPALSAVRQDAEAYREPLLELLTALIRIRSLSGESAEDAQALVRNWLSDLPYDIEQSADRPSRYEDHAEYMEPNPPDDGPFINIVGRPREQRGAAVGLFSHIDTHLLVDGWESDPFEPKFVGSRMYGLGTSDDKGGIAAMLLAARMLNDAGEPLPVIMSLHGKGGGSRGSLPVFERMQRKGERLDGVLYVHPAETGRGLADIKNEVQGVVDLELQVSGWRAAPMEIGSLDSAPWEQGGNALAASWKALDLLRNGAFAGVAMNVGILQGGDRPGAVADRATSRFRLKFGGKHSWRELLQAGNRQLESIAAQLATDTGRYALSLQVAGYRTNPGRADWESPYSRVLRKSIADITGQAPGAYPNHYAGDIRFPIRLLQAPAYGIGSLGGNFYGPNEWVDVDDLLNLVSVIVRTVTGWSAAHGMR